MTRGTKPMTDALIDELEVWSIALKNPINRQLTINQIAAANGACITVAIDKAAKALQSHAAHGAVSDAQIDAALDSWL